MSVRIAANRERMIYVALFALAAIAGFAKTLVYARILAPAEFGVFALAVLVTTFSAYFATAGILEGLACQVPILLGQGRDTVNIRSSAFSGVVLITLSVGVLLIIGCAVVANHQPSLASLIWTAPFFVTTVVVSALLVDLQIRELSIQYALVLFLKSFLAPIIALPLAPSLGASGVLIAETAGLIVCAVLCILMWSRDLGLSVRFYAAIKPIVFLGLPFTASNLLQNLATNIDRWAVQIVFGVATLGTYAFAMNFASMGLVLLSMVQLYAAPRMLRAYGVSNDAAVVLAQARRLAIGALFVFGIGAIPALVLFPVFVEKWFPQYAGANELIIWVYLGTAATTMGFFDVLFRAVGDGRPLVAIQFTVVMSAAAACLVAGWFGLPPVTYAAIFGGARLVSSGLGWVLAVRRCSSFAPHVRQQ